MNRGQGPAVLGLRAQIDRERYPKLMQDEIVNKTPNLYVLEASVDDLVIKENGGEKQIGGCVLDDGTVPFLFQWRELVSRLFTLIRLSSRRALFWTLRSSVVRGQSLLADEEKMLHMRWQRPSENLDWN